MSIFYTATHLIRLFRKITSNTGRIGLTRCAIFWLRYHQPACSSSYASASKKPIHSSYALTVERGAPTVCLCLRYGNVSSPCWMGPPPFQIRHLHLSDTAYAVVSYLRKSQMWTFVVQFCDSLAYSTLRNISKMWSAIWRRQYALAVTYPLPICFAVISSPPGRCRTYRLQYPFRTEYRVEAYMESGSCVL